MGSIWLIEQNITFYTNRRSTLHSISHWRNMFLHHNKLIHLIPISAAACEFVILHRCRDVEKPLSTHWHRCNCTLMYQHVVASQFSHYQFHKNVTFDLKIAPCDQGCLNSIIDPRENSALWSIPTQTLTEIKL